MYAIYRLIRKAVPEALTSLYKGIYQIPLLLPQRKDMPPAVRILPLYRLNIRELALYIRKMMHPYLQAVRDNGVLIYLQR